MSVQDFTEAELSEIALRCEVLAKQQKEQLPVVGPVVNATRMRAYQQLADAAVTICAIDRANRLEREVQREFERADRAEAVIQARTAPRTMEPPHRTGQPTT